MFDESFEEAWLARFGVRPEMAYPDLAPFLRHRCVRKYSGREVPESLASALVGAAQSAGTSSNLQLYSIVSVQEPERRQKLYDCCDRQQQILDASWFFAFCVDHHRLRKAAASVGESAKGLDYQEFFLMSLVDAALACERMVAAGESIGLGSCYIGALRNDAPAIQELLELPYGVFGAFGLCVGWPAEDAKAEIKPRLAQRAIWFRERYDGQAGIADYDERMRSFYLSQKMKGEVTWSMRSGRRADDRHLTGREVLKPYLEKLGFNLK